MKSLLGCIVLILALTSCKTPTATEPAEAKSLLGGPVAMRGRFTGIATIVGVDRGLLESWIPAELLPLVHLDYPDQNNHPIIILSGTQNNVAAQMVGRFMVLPPLRQYKEVMIMIPFLKLNDGSEPGHVWTFARIYVDNQRVVDLSTRLNKSPKEFALFKSPNDVTDVSQSDVTVLSLKQTSTQLPDFTLQEESLIREMLAQIKVEMDDGELVRFDFNLIKNAPVLTPKEIITSLYLGSKLAKQDQPITLQSFAGQKPLSFQFEGPWLKSPR